MADGDTEAGSVLWKCQAHSTCSGALHLDDDNVAVVVDHIFAVALRIVAEFLICCIFSGLSA